MGFTVDYSNARLEGPLSQGVFVKVEGAANGFSVTAHEVELEDEAGDEDQGNFETRGIIENLDTNSQTFTLEGTSFIVNYASARVEGSLANGLNIKVEGDLSGSVVLAFEVETDTGDGDDSNDDSNDRGDGSQDD